MFRRPGGQAVVDGAAVVLRVPVVEVVFGAVVEGAMVVVVGGGVGVVVVLLVPVPVPPPPPVPV